MMYYIDKAYIYCMCLEQSCLSSYLRTALCKQEREYNLLDDRFTLHYILYTHRGRSSYN